MSFSSSNSALVIKQICTNNSGLHQKCLFNAGTHFLTHLVFRYQVSYHCLFDLKLFPFDEQECLMVFRMRSATSKRVILNPGTLNYLGHKNMVEFVLEELIMQNGNTIVILISVKVWNHYFGFFLKLKRNSKMADTFGLIP